MDRSLYMDVMHRTSCIRKYLNYQLHRTAFSNQWLQMETVSLSGYHTSSNFVDWHYTITNGELHQIRETELLEYFDQLYRSYIQIPK